jgi:hypothetical protein
LRRIRLASILFAVATVACAPVPALSAQDQAAFAPRSDPAYGDATPALRALVAGTKGPQHFCAIAYRGPEGMNAWVHWREGNRLIYWPGGASSESLRYSPRNLDLAKDVVASEADVAGSTYLVTKAWVAAKLSDCAARGDHYTISAT